MSHYPEGVEEANISHDTGEAALRGQPPTFAFRPRQSHKNLTASQQTNYPPYIYVYGLPIMLSGWNGRYELVMVEGKPEWHRHEHIYPVLGIAIRPVKIHFVDGRWQLVTTDWSKSTFARGHNRQNSPVGYWGDIVVESEFSALSWATVNWGKMAMISALGASAVYLLH